eukprot:TRINITY_DN10170_c0_g1_i1.p2 TRINITY_DN10170_c0_g1~~TRINITY_DN10170_c0_g1_i1.p2  ORF type:complete len:188 (+),score=-20.49 TRINITY_DN10170_c0_g1_i1:299-862(+)
MHTYRIFNSYQNTQPLKPNYTYQFNIHTRSLLKQSLCSNACIQFQTQNMHKMHVQYFKGYQSSLKQWANKQKNAQNAKNSQFFRFVRHCFTQCLFAMIFSQLPMDQKTHEICLQYFYDDIIDSSIQQQLYFLVLSSSIKIQKSAKLCFQKAIGKFLNIYYTYFQYLFNYIPPFPLKIVNVYFFCGYS